MPTTRGLKKMHRAKPRRAGAELIDHTTGALAARGGSRSVDNNETTSSQTTAKRPGGSNIFFCKSRRGRDHEAIAVVVNVVTMINH